MDHQGNPIFLAVWGITTWFIITACHFTILYSKQQGTKVTISPHPHHYLLFSVLSVLIVAILISGVKWYFIIILIWNSLTISEIEQIYHVLIGHSYIFFGDMSFHNLHPFLNLVWFSVAAVILKFKELSIYSAY